MKDGLREAIAAALRNQYDSTLKEPIPDDMKRLLDKLD